MWRNRAFQVVLTVYLKQNFEELSTYLCHRYVGEPIVHVAGTRKGSRAVIYWIQELMIS
jgi:hypothetical protein